MCVPVGAARQARVCRVEGTWVEGSTGIATRWQVPRIMQHEPLGIHVVSANQPFFPTDRLLLVEAKPVWGCTHFPNRSLQELVGARSGPVRGGARVTPMERARCPLCRCCWAERAALWPWDWGAIGAEGSGYQVVGQERIPTRRERAGFRAVSPEPAGFLEGTWEGRGARWVKGEGDVEGSLKSGPLLRIRSEPIGATINQPVAA